ncbi:interleukin-6 [Eleutherodactylus coqui]|uniref:interleukin-6 n=1 Tax=Eleutherodactylus coqui TaxID=57060 RepID=UPI003461EC9B
MDCRKSTSSEWFLVYLAITAILPAVWSAPTFPNHQTKLDLENVVNVLISEGGKLYSEICKTPNLCRNSAEHLVRMDLKLPEITDIKSGCLSKNFDKKKCLPKIYRDLLSFQTYLDFLKESMPSSKNIIDSMQLMSVQLAKAVKDLEDMPSEDKEDTTPGITVADLRSNNQWSQNLTSYIILQSFKEYMEKAARAIRAVNILK